MREPFLRWAALDPAACRLLRTLYALHRPGAAPGARPLATVDPDAVTPQSAAFVLAHALDGVAYRGWHAERHGRGAWSVWTDDGAPRHDGTDDGSASGAGRLGGEAAALLAAYLGALEAVPRAAHAPAAAPEDGPVLVEVAP